MDQHSKDLSDISNLECFAFIVKIEQIIVQKTCF